MPENEANSSFNGFHARSAGSSPLLAEDSNMPYYIFDTYFVGYASHHLF